MHHTQKTLSKFLRGWRCYSVFYIFDFAQSFTPCSGVSVVWRWSNLTNFKGESHGIDPL